MSGCAGIGKRIAQTGVVLLAVGVIFCGLSFGAGGHEGGSRSADLLDLLYRFINFALLVIILFVVLKKVNIGGLLSARGEEIKQNMDELRARKEEADRKYRELEKRIREFEASRQGIVEQFRAEGLAEKNRLIAEAEERVKQILLQAESAIQREMETAKSHLQQDMIAMATRNAEAILSKEITENDQERLVNDFIERLGRTH
jgi:F-type H+-transporting ATPase subunit b